MPVMSAPARRGEYGVDAPYVPAYMALGALALLLAAALTGALGWSAWLFFLSGALYLVASIALYLYASRVGKFAIWSEILDELRLRGDERVLDLGCGRGAVLLVAWAVLLADAPVFGTFAHAATVVVVVDRVGLALRGVEVEKQRIDVVLRRDGERVRAEVDPVPAGYTVDDSGE